MKIEFLAKARTELTRAAAWYERKASLGDAFIGEIDAKLSRVAALPYSFPPHPDDPSARRALVARFPYAIVFVAEAHRIVVVAIAHQKRRRDYWMDTRRRGG